MRSDKEHGIEQEPQAEGLYPIGAVAALTGLSPNTIRTWERRHEVVTPQRSPAGGRRYTDGDIERLQLLRRLTQRGFPIGAASKLKPEALRQRLRASGSLDAGVAMQDLRVGLLHSSLQARITSASARWTIALQATALQAFLDAATPCDLVIAELGLLGDAPEDALERCVEAAETRNVLVLYHFAKREVLSGLVSAGARLVREPTTLEELVERVTEQVSANSAGSSLPSAETREQLPRPPRYDAVQLARLREIGSSVGCECPNHLATLLTSLAAFEDYSRRCQSDSPQDAALHGRLYAQTGQARVIMEDLLKMVCENDGIEL